MLKLFGFCLAPLAVYLLTFGLVSLPWYLFWVGYLGAMVIAGTILLRNGDHTNEQYGGQISARRQNEAIAEYAAGVKEREK